MSPRPASHLQPPSPAFEPTNGVSLSPSDDWQRRPSLAFSPLDELATAAEPTFASPSPRDVYRSPSVQATPVPYGSPPGISALSPQHYQGELRGGFSHVSPPTSPRVTQRLSGRSPPQRDYLGLEAYMGAAASPRGRPVSMPNAHSPALNSPHFGLSPPQHVLRDRPAALHSRSTSRKMDDFDYLGFDTLPPVADDGSSTECSALLLSAHHSLYVYEVGTESLKYHGHIEGLRGQVMSAKILPVSRKADKLRHLRPLVVLIVHGPYIPRHDATTAMGLDKSQHSEFDPSESVMQAMQTVAQGPVSETQFQTTVELYSLKERQHLTTLYRSPVVDAEPVRGERWGLNAPPPVGGLSVHAKGRFVVVASAVSGEVFIYTTSSESTEADFFCIGKTWTGTPVRKGRSWSTSSGSAASDTDGQAEASTPVKPPVLSLSPRWLAVMPPLPSSKTTLHGTVDAIRRGKNPPGLRSHAPGSQPVPTCELDTPLEDSRLNRVARDVAQEVLKGAQWVGAQGMQAWKNYWSKPSEPSSSQEQLRHARPIPQFPPTHADDTRVAQSPTLVAILDLERLAENAHSQSDSALNPIAVFPLPDGCSFLSFSPSGLQLLTASVKGDVQYAWDLMRMVHSRPETFAGSTPIQGPLVRQIARFTRVTQANILDVIWAEPRGERLAILTDRGTIHLHDIPPSAFSWPPPRVKRPVSPPKQRSSDIVPQTTGWGATISSVTGAAQPILAAARDTRLPSFSGLNISSAGAGAGRQGSKIVATGFSKSVGAATGTVNSLRHMGESRFSVPTGSGTHCVPGTVHWLNGRETQLIAVVGDRKVRLYSVVSKVDKNSKTKRRYSAVGIRLAEHVLPVLKDTEARLPLDGILLGGFWPVPTSARTQRGIRPTIRDSSDPAPLSYAELENCAPFQPLHADKRVVLKCFDDSFVLKQHGREARWVFGEGIPSQPIQKGTLGLLSAGLDLSKSTTADIRGSRNLPSSASPPPASKASLSKGVSSPAHASPSPPKPAPFSPLGHQPVYLPRDEHEDEDAFPGMSPLLPPTADSSPSAPPAASSTGPSAKVTATRTPFPDDDGFDPLNPLDFLLDENDDEGDDAMGPIASFIRPSGAERADGAGFSEVTVASRPVKKAKKKGKEKSTKRKPAWEATEDLKDDI